MVGTASGPSGSFAASSSTRPDWPGGVALVCVDPAYTSQACNECGYCEKTNRRTQSEFICKGCGHVAHADTNAARNIRSRASVMVPIAAGASA